MTNIHILELCKTSLHVTHLLELLDKMYKYEMGPDCIVKNTEQTHFRSQTDGWMDKMKPVSPLRQWCGWNSTQHQTWRRVLREEFVHASILCWIELCYFGVGRYIWKRTNKCGAELQTLGGKNSSVFNTCKSGLMLGGKFQTIRGMLGGKFEDAGWKLHERVRKRSK